MAPARAGLAAAGLIDVEFTNVARMGITGVVDPQPCYVERDDCHADSKFCRGWTAAIVETA